MAKPNMSTNLLLLIGCALLSLIGADDAQCGRHRTARIIGGWNAGTNEYPMVAGLWNNRFDKVICASTIVSNHHVVTAAHCLRNNANPTPQEMKVLVGANDYRHLSNSPYGKSYDVDRFIIHPNFGGTGSSDVALVRTQHTIEYNAAVGPVCLPYGNDQYAGRFVDLLGWGKTAANGQVSSVLQKTSMWVITYEACRSHWGDWVKPQHLCTHTRGRDFCIHDSGGPVFEESNGRVTLIGIIGWGGCLDGKPGGSARVSLFSRWINENSRN